jgi:transcriptional regulator with XRE-family HTH domain
MSLQGGKTKIANRLWKARKRRGLGQKQIAFLMGKSVGEVSRYERGVRLPELHTILAIEIAYGAPLRVLYKDLYKQVLKEICQRVETQAGAGSVYGELLAGTDLGTQHYCEYVEIFKISGSSSQEREQVRDHVVWLAKKLAGL